MDPDLGGPKTCGSSGSGFGSGSGTLGKGKDGVEDYYPRSKDSPCLSDLSELERMPGTGGAEEAS
jgi:hypothetical protein